MRHLKYAWQLVSISSIDNFDVLNRDQSHLNLLFGLNFADVEGHLFFFLILIAHTLTTNVQIFVFNLLNIFFFHYFSLYYPTHERKFHTQNEEFCFDRILEGGIDNTCCLRIKESVLHFKPRLRLVYVTFNLNLSDWNDILAIIRYSRNQGDCTALA